MAAKPTRSARKAHPPSPAQPPAAAEGGCACGAVRFRFTDAPLFVHCCHCTRCQRETGAPFAHHAVIERTRLELLQGDPVFTLAPADSGRKHYVARCAGCGTAMWNCWGSREGVVAYVRVGAMDEPARFPPLAHIYVRSKQPWLALPDDASLHAGYYDGAKTWPAESLARYEAARAAQAAKPRAGAARAKGHRKT